MVIQFVGYLVLGVDVIQAQPVGDVPLQGEAVAVTIRAVEPVLEGVGVIPEGVAIPLVVGRCHPHPVAQGHVDSTRQIALVVITGGCPQVKAQFIPGILGHEIDRPGNGVAAVEGTLGTLEDFDSLQVGDIHAGSHHLTDVDAVDVSGGAWINGKVGRAVANAPDVQAHVRGCSRRGIALHTGDLIHQVHGASDAPGLYLLGIQHLDGNRSFLQVGCPAFRRDDHFLELGQCRFRR